MQAKAKCAVVLLLGCSSCHVQVLQTTLQACSLGTQGELGLEPAALSAHGCAALGSAQAGCGLQVLEVQQAVSRGTRAAASLVQCNCNVDIASRGVLSCQVSLFFSFVWWK